MTTPEALIAHLRQSRGFLHKHDIAPLVGRLEGRRRRADHIPLGDDCAAIPDGDGYLLFAIEGFLNDFVERDPWFAGYCGVMVNVSDIYAMGGRPIAVVDALWSRDGERGRQILAGMAEASAAYRIPIVGGHTNCRNDREHLAVAILGRAKTAADQLRRPAGRPPDRGHRSAGRLSRALRQLERQHRTAGRAPARRPGDPAVAGRGRTVPRRQGHQHGGRVRHGADADGKLGRWRGDRRGEHPHSARRRA